MTAGERRGRVDDPPGRQGAGATVAVTVAAIGFGFSPFFATRAFDAGVDPVAASFLRVVVLFVALTPWAAGLRGWVRESCWVFIGGAVSMLGFAGYFLALDQAPVAAATVVYYTYPVAVLVLSAFVWKQPMRTADVAVAATIIVGVAIAVGPSAVDVDVLVALAPALAAPVGWAIYLLVLSGPAGAMPTMPKVWVGAGGGAAVLLPLTLMRTGVSIAPLTAEVSIAVVSLTLCSLAIPAVLVTWGAPRAGERATGMIGSLEFVVALAVSWILMGDALGPAQFVGATLVCVAVAMASARTSSKPKPHLWESRRAPRRRQVAQVD